MPSIPSKTILVNFRILPDALVPFDNACSLVRRTRTDVLTELMQRFVENASEAISERSKETMRTDSKPISRPIDSEPAKDAGDVAIGVQNRALRRFSTLLGLGRGAV